MCSIKGEIVKVYPRTLSLVVSEKIVEKAPKLE